MLIANSGGEAQLTTDRERVRRWLFPIIAVTAVAVFLVAPWSFEHKAHAVLHGLCAQRPSHSLRLGDRVLPFDARMTGIYGGCLVAAGYLALRGRSRAFRLPPPATLATLGCFVAAMALDGLNSLLLDLGLWHPYAPDNRLRLATGLLTGTALAVVLCFVLATTIWREGRWEQPVVAGVRELLVITALQVPVALAALSSIGALYVPIAMLLLLAAAAVVAALMLVVLLLLRRADRSFVRVAELSAPGAVALVLAIAVMAAIAGGRVLLERLTDAPPLT